MTECYHEHDGCECEALTKDLNSELARWRELPKTVAKLLNRPENYWETHVNQPLAMASAFALILEYPALHRDSYKVLHRKITEGLVRCAEDEYLGRLGEVLRPMRHKAEHQALNRVAKLYATESKRP